MKLLSIVFLVVTTISYAQEVTIYHRDGTIINTKISATSGTQILTKDGNFAYDVIDSLASTDAKFVTTFYEKKAAFLSPKPKSSGSLQVVVNGVDINKLDMEYVSMVGTSQFLSTKVTVTIDYGQETKFLSAVDQRVQGSDGKAQKFNGMTDALNFMYRNGWEYHDAYTITHGNSNVYHYILRRKD